MPFYLGGEKVSEETFSVKAPAATDVWVYSCPGLTALPDLPAATYVRVENCPNINPASRAA